MFSKNLGVMLYVNDVAAEKVFWEAVGFDIVAESEVMGFETFDMKSHADSTATFTVYAKEFIRQLSYGNIFNFAEKDTSSQKEEENSRTEAG